MIIGVPKETFPGERRVALTPAVVATLTKSHRVRIQSGAGAGAGCPDAQYADKGAEIVYSRPEAFEADCILQVRAAGYNQPAGQDDAGLLRTGQVLIAQCDPLGSPGALHPLVERGITLFSLELVPRITRAQSMDVLSSQASIAGYRAVLLAAGVLPKMFPMMTTAAGTITPAKVFVMGAGVAGLQAIATAKRLGAVVSANDVRSAVKEQVQSLGGKFLEMPQEGAAAEGAGGYARAMDEDFYRRQREFIAKIVADQDVVITTAAVPGKKAPVLLTEEMVRGMQPGSVIVDLAAERGGNCALTRLNETVDVDGVKVLGPGNLPADVPLHASQMFAKNVTTFLATLLDKDGKWHIHNDDEVIRETLVARDGQVVNPRVKEALGG